MWSPCRWKEINERVTTVYNIQKCIAFNLLSLMKTHYYFDSQISNVIFQIMLYLNVCVLMLILVTNTEAEKSERKITVADSSSLATSRATTEKSEKDVKIQSKIKDEVEEWPVREMIAILGSSPGSPHDWHIVQVECSGSGAGWDWWGQYFSWCSSLRGAAPGGATCRRRRWARRQF